MFRRHQEYFFHDSFIFIQNKSTKEKWTKISVLKILGEKYKQFRRHFGSSRQSTIFYNRTVLEV
jgi:hypothetical protein